MVCTFFGHREFPLEFIPQLKQVIIKLIDDCKVDVFYVGNQGGFDFTVFKLLNDIRDEYGHIKFYIVLAYLPRKNNGYTYYDYSDTIYPEGIENVHPKFAIIKRNEWMLKRADIVVTYVEHNYGGAWQFKILAEKKGKIVINIG